MAESININRSFISFPSEVKYSIGQKIQTDNEYGYVIGIKLGRFEWEYLIAMGDSPTGDSEEQWVHQHQINWGQQ